MKKIGVIHNTAGGIDLITERDSGNEVRILTGRSQNSLEFWRKIREVSEAAIQELQRKGETNA